MSHDDTLLAPAERTRGTGRGQIAHGRARDREEWEQTAVPPPWDAGGRAASHDARPPSPAAAVLGGRYRLVERLGAGGFGVVWRAHDTALHRDVAVKAIPLPVGEDAAGEDARAAREALATARLAHPAIVALYEARAEGEHFYLVTELVDGDTLAALIDADALADEEVLDIGVALADALAHAHARGVVHRDLKPHNVLVPHAPTGGASAKLTDFGGALLAGEDALTRTGDVLGTLAYMAPEQLDGAAVDERADLYALALVVYEGLTGVNPVRGPTPAATARRVGNVLPPLARHRPDLPREVTGALDRALRPVPGQRGSLAELRAALLATASPARRHAPGWRRPGRQEPLVPRSPAPQWPSSSRPATTGSAATAEHAPEDEAEPGVEASRGWLTLSRLCWVVVAAGVCTWQLTAAHAGVAALVVCAVAPLLAAVRRPGPRWLAPALAPALGLVGLAVAYPALAGQAARWRARALLGALGWWWLRLADLPLGGSVASVGHAALRLPGLALVAGLALWAGAAVTLPWLVRGRAATLDALGAAVWAGAVCAATVALHRHFASPVGVLPSSREAVLGTALGVALAVVARAVRGPVASATA